VVITSILVILISMVPPLLFFKKTPLWAATPLSFFIFNRVLLWPNEDNNF